MTRGTLKTIRLTAPVIVGLGLYAIMAKVLGFTQVKIPTKIDEILFNIPLLVAAVAYTFSPLRPLANSKFHGAVNENIRARMVRMAQLPDDPQKFSWVKVKNVFYRRIDADASLGKRSEDLMNNGAIWTTLADLTVLSALFALGAVALWIAGFPKAPEVTAIFALISISSRVMQGVVTNHHIRLGNDQLDYIEQYHQATVQAEMQAL